MLPPALFPGAELNGLQNIISHSLLFLVVTMPLHKNDMQVGKKSVRFQVNKTLLQK